MALLPLVALLAGAGIAAGVLQAISDDPPASTAEAAEQRDSRQRRCSTPPTTSAGRWTR